MTVYSADGEKVIKLPTASSTITEIMIGDLTFGAVTTTSSATGLDWGYKSNGKIDWKGPKGNIAANQLMIGQIAPAEGLLSVTPASVDLSGMTLELIDTKVISLPLISLPLRIVLMVLQPLLELLQLMVNGI